MGHWKIPPKTVTKKSNRDISKRVKFIAAAYTAPKENRAECIIPVQNILTVANGEVLYKPFISMYPNFLNLGAFLFVSKIGIRAEDNNKEISIKGSYFSGLLKFNKRVPTERPIKVINI